MVRTVAKVLDPGHFAPAGPIHLGIMFGPLVIENGIPEYVLIPASIENDAYEHHSSTSGGVLITSRPTPSLCYESTASLLFDKSDAHSGQIETSAAILFEKDTRRIIQIESRVQRYRQLLASVKRVYGGAFSGRDVRLREKEAAVVHSLIEASDSFRYIGSKSVAANRTRLHAKATRVMALVRDLISHDVDTHLKKFCSVLLDSETTLRWHPISNTCQDFADRLLRDKMFEGILPKFPREFLTDVNVRAEPKLSCIRYVVSMGTSIDTPLALLSPQHRSVVWRYYHEIRDNCDLIEYAERVTQKQASIPQHVRRILVPNSPESAFDMSVVDVVDQLWQLPRDTLSMLQTHLLRTSEKYSSAQGLRLTRREWAVQRLRVLWQLDLFASFAGAWASTWLAEFVERPEKLLSHGFLPDAATYGTVHAGEKTRNFRVGSRSYHVLTGRERSRWKVEMRYELSRLKGRLPFIL